MPQLRRRPAAPVVIAATIVFGVFSGPVPEARPLFQPRPGPIDHPLAMVTADFDRDGLDDLAIAQFQAGVVTILLGQADGTFVPSPTSPNGVGAATFSAATTGPLGLIVADMNPVDADGDTIPNASDNCPNVANGPNGPGGTAASQIDSSVPPNGVGDACEILGDTDNDGDKDDPIDTDGDGVFDFDPVTLRLDNCPRMPNPGSPQVDLTSGAGPNGVCGDFDDMTALFGPNGVCGDDDDLVGDKVGDACQASPDLLVLTNSLGGGSVLGAVRVRVNDGSGGWHTDRPSLITGVGPGQAILADVIGDKFPDLLIANVASDVVQVYLGQSDGQFIGSSLLAAGDGPQAIVAADIDDDGDLDAITANSLAGTLSLFRNTSGALAVSPSETFDTGGHPAVLLSGLLNDDDIADIVVLTQGASCVGGTFDQQPCNVNADCDDPDPDGKDGTCTGLGTGGGMQVFTGAAAGASPALVAGPLLPFGAGHRPRAGALRDLDGDLELDLAVADLTGGEVRILQGNGDGTFGAFQTAVTLDVVGEPADLAFPKIAPAMSTNLAVLDSANNRVDLFAPTTGLAYVPASTSPASPWRDTRGMALIAADGLVGFDVVLLQSQDARVDVLSGIGDGSFRATPSLRPKVVAEGANVTGSALAIADFRQDGRPDLAVLDGAAGTVTVYTGELNGQLLERGTASGGAGAVRADAAPLFESIVDYDRDGIDNVVDDCPGVYNPPGCKVTDSLCAPIAPFVCANDALAPNDCGAMDPLTGQCDSDRNGIGDLCQVLGAAEATPETCFNVDSDFDLKPDYDQTALKRTPGGALDFDGDGIGNLSDNCPTFANPGQEDANGNTVGDACEILSAGQTVDPDGDEVDTWNPDTEEMDNCPAVYNPGQEDNDRAANPPNGDGIGNACIVRAALDNCLGTINNNQQDIDGDGLGDLCAVPPQDLFLANPASATLGVMRGDGLGGLRPASVPLPATPGPLGARSGRFTLVCTLLGVFCQDKEELEVFDLVVAETVTLNNPSDDRIAVLSGDADGGFTALPDFPFTGFSDTGALPALLRVPDQQVCPVSGSPSTPQLRYDPDTLTDLVIALGAADSTVSVLLPSNQNSLNPALSPLVRPVAFGSGLPVEGTLRDVVVANVNQDSLQDLVAISTIGTQTKITPFIGIGGGLFFTDPSLWTTALPFDARRLQSANVDIKSDVLYPDLVLFEQRDQAPFSLLNTLPERADIDGSNRVDGYDLALLAASFAATRGEDFTLQPDATFTRTGSGFAEAISRTGSPVPGQDLPDSAGVCNGVFDPGSGRYGIPVDINLDGIVDGEDLAFIASRFGTTIR